ncbi:hypothetical protein LY78DRAFT_704987 [Colletotrichum sublineola]|nr:hypothetical protein LY78DRAFT_704987 [Colletotrichum sublineola]
MPRYRRDVLAHQFHSTKERFKCLEAQLYACPGQDWPKWYVKNTTRISYCQVVEHLESTSLCRVSKHCFECLSHFRTWNKIMGYGEPRLPTLFAKFVPSPESSNAEEDDAELIRYRQNDHRINAQTADRPLPDGYDETAILIDDEHSRCDEPLPFQDRPFEIRAPNLYQSLKFSYDLNETNRLMGFTTKVEVFDGQDPHGRRVLVIAFGFTSGFPSSDTLAGREEIATAYKIALTWA